MGRKESNHTKTCDDSQLTEFLTKSTLFILSRSYETAFTLEYYVSGGCLEKEREGKIGQTEIYLTREKSIEKKERFNT